MAQTERLTDDQRQRLNDRHETLLRSMILLRGDMVSLAQISLIVGRATKAATPEEAHSLVPSTSAANLLQQFLKETVESDGKRGPTNIYSAEGARAEQAGRAASAPKSGIDADRLEQSRLSRQQQQDAAASPGATDRASGSTSGARYDGMGSLDWSSPAGLAKMRDYAIQSGVPWAANSPELLRLGPGAVAALAEVHFKQETYKRLATDASFKAKDVVVLARFAREQHVDANKLGGDLATAEKPLSPQERERLNGAVVPYMADPKDPAKRDRAVKAFESAAQAHPEDRPALERAQEDLHLKGEKLERENKAAVKKDSRAESEASRAADKDGRAGAEVSRTAGKENNANDKLAALDGLAAEPAAKPADSSKEEKAKASPQNTDPQPTKARPKTAAPAPHKLG